MNSKRSYIIFSFLIFSFLNLILFFFTKEKVLLTNLACILIYLLIFYNNEFRLLSPLSFFIFGTLVYYNLSIYLNYLLPTPAIRSDYIGYADDSIYMLFIFLIFFYLGSLFLSFFSYFRKTTTEVRTIINQKINIIFIIFFFLLFLFYIFLSFRLGFFYSGVTAEYNPSIGNVSWLFIFYQCGILSMSLLLLKADYQDSYDIFRVFLFLSFIIIFLYFGFISGKREQLFSSLLFISFIFLFYNRITIFKLIIVILGIVFSAFSIGLIGLYRPYALNVINAMSLEDRVNSFFTVLEYTGLNISNLFVMFVDRISMFYSPGIIYERVPNAYNFIGYSDYPSMISLLLPSFLRTNNYNAVHSAAIHAQELDIGYAASMAGSEPLMLIGDLFLRSGMSSIIIFGFIIGLVITFYDYILREINIKVIVVLSLISYDLIILQTMPLAKSLQFLTRDIIILIMVVFLIDYLFRKIFLK